MTFRTLALVLALGSGLVATTEAKSKSAHSAPVYKVKKSRHKTAKARKVKPAVKQPKKSRHAR